MFEVFKYKSQHLYSVILWMLDVVVEDKHVSAGSITAIIISKDSFICCMLQICITFNIPPSLKI